MRPQMRQPGKTIVGEQITFVLWHRPPELVFGRCQLPESTQQQAARQLPRPHRFGTAVIGNLFQKLQRLLMTSGSGSLPGC